MAALDPWVDYDSLRHNVKHNTVDRLKHILAGFNEECTCSLFRSGKKQDLIDRIVGQLQTWRQSNNVEQWTRAKAVLYQVRNNGYYTPNRLAGSSSAPTMPSIPYTPSIPRPAVWNSGPVTGTTSIGRYDPFAPPRRPAAACSVPSSSSLRPVIQFKPSPFFRIDEAVTPVIECPESTSATDRKQQSLSFSLTSEQIQKLNSDSQAYQLRLFCTSSIFYQTGPNAFRSTAGPCPIEFPPTCEVRVNGVQLSANLKGLKKKPGTAPPADLGKTVRHNTTNRVEMVYVNSQQPTQAKKFYMVVMLVEITDVSDLVAKMKKGKYRSNDDIVQQMSKTSLEDDDIVAGPQKMSLKCPLSFMRIVSPCRSTTCVHPQCFDATSWFSVMEQTTTWLCPVCERVLNFEDLFIDGYFDQILRETPDSVEDVMVEADGQWHTSDNKYGSPAWKAAHRSATPMMLSTPSRPSSPTKSPSRPPLDAEEDEADGKAKIKSEAEILILDSDDEDEGRVKRELSVSRGSVASSSLTPRAAAAQRQRKSNGGDVIDLTFDSEDEERQESRQLSKRKASGAVPSSPTEPIWKKSRLPTPAPQHNGVNGRASVASSSPRSSHVGGGSLASNSPNGVQFPSHLPSSSPQPNARLPSMPIFHAPAPPYATGYYSAYKSTSATPMQQPPSEQNHQTHPLPPNPYLRGRNSSAPHWP